MAKVKKNLRCPLQGECERKCQFELKENECDYFHANLRPEVEEDARRVGIKLPTFGQTIDWDAVPDELADQDESDDPDIDFDTLDRAIDVANSIQISGQDEYGGEDLPAVTVDDGKVQYLGGERGYTAKIQECINNVRHEFMFIGLLLCEVDGFGYYRESGFADVYEYCEVTFGFKRSSTNNFMRVYRKFGEAMGIQEHYKKYSYSQLTEMCSMNDRQLSQCNPCMTVQKLREIKKPPNYMGVTVSDRPPSVQTSGSCEIHDSNHSYQIPAWLVSKMMKLFGGFSRDKVFDALDAGLVSIYGCKSGYMEY